MHKNAPIKKLDSSIHNGQSLVSTCDIVCVGNGRFFYFNENGKLDLHVIVKKDILFKKNHQFFSLNALKWLGTHQMEMACVFRFYWIRCDGSWVL